MSLDLLILMLDYWYRANGAPGWMDIYDSDFDEECMAAAADEMRRRIADDAMRAWPGTLASAVLLDNADAWRPFKRLVALWRAAEEAS